MADEKNRPAAPQEELDRHTQTETGGAYGILADSDEPYEPRGKDRVVTSSGTAPTGGIPVGGAADRSIPEKEVRDSASATNA